MIGDLEGHSSIPAEIISIADPWISRHGSSKLLEHSDGPAGSEAIHTKILEAYGDPSHPIAFCVGNGGAGYTGILRTLAETYLKDRGEEIRIGWVVNHSRHSQIALLADVVQVALTYEPGNEDIAIEERWCSRIGGAFNDHFILVGPEVDVDTRSLAALMQAIRESSMKALSDPCVRPLVFHSRGDGSATFAKETKLFGSTGIDISRFVNTHPCTPYEALQRAEREQAFLLTDRATFLTAKRDNVIPSLRAHVEGGKLLLNPCSALVRSSDSWQEGEPPLAHERALSFARWLCGPEAQRIIADYGRDWPLGKPLFTVASQEDFNEVDRLVPS